MVRGSGARQKMSAQVARRAFSFQMFGEIVAELRRVTWPTRQETMRLTIMVVLVSATIGAFLGFVDLGFARLFAVILGN